MDEDGAQAVYSFSLDDELLVNELRHEELEDPTYRVKTTKTTVEEIREADDVAAAIRQGLWNRQIDVTRVVEPFPGLPIHIGVVHLVAGGGALVSLAVVKIWFGSIRAFLPQVVQGMSNAFETAWKYLSRIRLETILGVLALLEWFDLKEPVQKVIRRLAAVFLAPIRSVRDAISNKGHKLGESDNKRESSKNGRDEGPPE